MKRSWRRSAAVGRPSTTPTGNGYLADSGILVRDLRGDHRASDLLSHLYTSAPLAVSTMTAFEVIRGCRSERQEAQTLGLLQVFDIVDVDFEVARTGAELMRAHPRVLSSTQSVPDALIAATAIVRGLTLITLNRRQFARLKHPDLDLVLLNQDAADWVADVS